MIVTVLGRTFTYKPLLFSWMANAMGRMNLLGIGGPSKYVSCSNCWQHSSFLENGTWYPAGYADPVKVWVEEGGHHLQLYAGDYYEVACLPMSFSSLSPRNSQPFCHAKVTNIFNETMLGLLRLTAKFDYLRKTSTKELILRLRALRKQK
jgi:hypothetical protein